MSLVALIGASEIPLTWQSARPAVDALMAADESPALISSDFKSAAATVKLGELHGPGVSLNVATANWSPAQAAEAMRGQRETVRASASTPQLRWAGGEHVCQHQIHVAHPRTPGTNQG